MNTSERKISGGAYLMALAFILFCACNTSTTPAPKSSTQESDSASETGKPVKPAFKKPPSSYNDTVVVKDIAAVFFNSDSVQLEKVKAITEPGFYESVTHEGFYQQRNARMVLARSWSKIHKYEVVKARYLEFVKTDGSKVYIDLNQKGDLCGIFLFNRVKDPQLIDMMNIDTVLYYYFDK